MRQTYMAQLSRQVEYRILRLEVEGGHVQGGELSRSHLCEAVHAFGLGPLAGAAPASSLKAAGVLHLEPFL
jgi:hypothetical protein